MKSLDYEDLKKKVE